MDALLYLEEAHLKELGVSLGHRVKLANAIAALRAKREQHKRAETRAGEIYGTAMRESGPANGGERRQLTLMFCDLVGSTELAASADPEEVRDVMRVYQDVCAGMITRYDGYLAKFLGDGVLAYFGYPHAYEDAAERAVRAARGIVASVSKLPLRGGHQLAVRVGIATGTVVVSQMTAADGASELSAIGETPNLAARLQALAEPNSVVIADSTRALTRGVFRYNDLGLRPTKECQSPCTFGRL